MGGLTKEVITGWPANFPYCIAVCKGSRGSIMSVGYVILRIATTLPFTTTFPSLLKTKTMS